MINSNEEILLSRKDGLSVLLTNFGARILSIKVPTDQGPSEVHEYHDDHSIYKTRRVHSGATIGPIANRIANAGFHIDAKIYAWEPNLKNHLIHFGALGWHLRHWKIIEQQADMVTYGIKNQVGDPVEYEALVTYMVTMDQALLIQYEVVVEEPFHINMTNHGYFNISKRADLSTHQFQIFADRIIEIDEDSIPTGKLLAVANTAFDLNQMKGIGDMVYDHNFVLIKEQGAMSLAAKAYASDTSLTMECYTTQPGIQFFNGYPGYFCFESQHFPDSPNQPNFPSTLVHPNKGYKEQCLYKFYQETSGAIGLV